MPHRFGTGEVPCCVRGYAGAIGVGGYRYSGLSGVGVKVVTLQPAGGGADIEGNLLHAGLLLPHSVASELLTEAIIAPGLRVPAVLVFRHGRLAAVLSDTGLERLNDVLPILFGAIPEPVAPS